MTSAEFYGSRPINAPDDWNQNAGQCAPLYIERGEHVIVGIPDMMSVWVPSSEERAQIAAGANIVLYVVGKAHPPVALAISQERILDEAPHDDWRP